MVELEEKLTVLQVVKRNGKKVDFNGSKIALAIQKGFDSVEDEDANAAGNTPKYTTKDVNKVYEGVLKRIEKEYDKEEKIKIETVQDMIEDELQKKGYLDVYESFSEYRERRAYSRKMFSDEKQLHKFLKAIDFSSKIG